MEKNKGWYNSPSSSLTSKLKNFFWWILLWTLLLTSCQENKDKGILTPQENEIEVINKSGTPIEIQWTREYKIYKLWLGSIIPIKWDIQKAQTKISNTPKLSSILSKHDVEFETIMPSIIKESMMNNDARSNSGAIWYFQLKPIAVKDVINFYEIGNLNLDVNNPIDNIILGSLYRKRSLDLLKQWIETNLSESDLEKMMILSYNAWPARIKSLFKESGSKNYKNFEKFLAKKIWVKKEPIKKTDWTYWVDYIDPLTDLDFDDLKNREEKKIAEWLRYVAIIEWISKYIKTSETIQVLWKIKCSRNTTLFWEIKKLRNQWVFKKDASINEICKIILETNWYWERETPDWVELLIIQNALTNYLP